MPSCGIQSLSLNYFESRSSGEIISRMMDDVASVTRLVGGTLLNTLVSLLKATALLFILFHTNTKIALVAITVLPLHFLWLQALGYFG